MERDWTGKRSLTDLFLSFVWSGMQGQRLHFSESLSIFAFAVEVLPVLKALGEVFCGESIPVCGVLNHLSMR
jgi:hypothetical protein